LLIPYQGISNGSPYLNEDILKECRCKLPKKCCKIKLIGLWKVNRAWVDPKAMIGNSKFLWFVLNTIARRDLKVWTFWFTWIQTVRPWVFEFHGWCLIYKCSDSSERLLSFFHYLNAWIILSTYVCKLEAAFILKLLNLMYISNWIGKYGCNQFKTLIWLRWYEQTMWRTSNRVNLICFPLAKGKGTVWTIEMILSQYGIVCSW